MPYENAKTIQKRTAKTHRKIYIILINLILVLSLDNMNQTLKLWLHYGKFRIK
jgi:hypothetical protein